MMKKYLALFLVFGFLAASAVFAHSIDLGISDPGTLPTSSFYFLKEWKRGVVRLFTFNAVKKADLELDILNEKAAETQKISEDDPQNIEAIKSALQNYIEANDRLAARLKALKETSQNPNVDKLLDKLVEKTAKHEKLFEDISKEFSDKDEVKGLAKSAQEDLDDAVSLASEKDDVKKFSERLKKNAEKAIDDKEDAAEKSAEQIKEAEGKIIELEKKIQKASAPSEQASKHLASAKERLDAAKTAFGEKKYGEAFGQARSAEVSARNGMKVLERETESKDDSKDKDDDKGDDKKSPEPQAAPFPKPIPQNRPIPRDAEIKFETSVTVVIDENGFNPREIGIKKGGKVTWVNQSQNSVWPASNPHPIHTNYHGFDALRGLAAGESYSFTFEKVGSWKYHNHLNPSMRGEVKVEE